MSKSGLSFIQVIMGLFWLTCQSFLSGQVWAGEIFPETTWESPQVPGTLYGAAAGRCPERCLVLLYKNKIVMMRLGKTSQEVSLMTEVRAGPLESFDRIHFGDFDGNGRPDVLVNGWQKDRVFSRWYLWQDGHFIPKKDFAATVMPLKWQGQTRLFSQTLRGRGEWSQTLKEIRTNGKTKSTKPMLIRLSKGLGSNPIGLFALQSAGERLVYLSDEGKLTLLDGLGKRVWHSGLKYGGAVDRIAFEGRDPTGIKSTQILGLPPRMAYHPESATLYVAKNSGFLPSAIGAFPDMKATEYVALKATANGLQETFVSRRFDGAISDLNLVDFDGDGHENEVLIVLWVRAGGLLESAEPASSKIVVINLQRPKGRGK